MRLTTLAVLFTFGCASNASHDRPSGPDAKFETATTAQLGVVLELATGLDARHYMVNLILARVAQPNRPTCPVIEGSDSSWTITGGCTDSGDTQWSGKATITNAPGFNAPSPSYDPTMPTTVQLDMLQVAYGGSATTDDGTIAYTGLGVVSWQDEWASYKSFDSAITSTAGHVTRSHHLHVSEDQTGLTITQPSWIELDGLGVATVSGAWSDGSTPSGTTTVHGADDLVFDWTQTSGQCVAYTIGSKTGMACAD